MLPHFPSFLHRFALVLPTAALAVLPWAAPIRASDDEPTFYADVLPILRENCQACHREAALSAGGMLAPMALETYEQARPWAPLIAEAVRERRMPPWGADERHRGTFVGERYLSEEDRETLIAWAEQGAPEGDPSQAPAAVAVAAGATETGWWLGQPDLVVEFPEPVLVGDEVADWQPTVVVPVSREAHPAPQWIQASELKAGGAYVHHIVSSHLGVGTPGRGPFVYPEGWGVLLPVDPVVTFNMHYYKDPGPGTAVEDETQGGFVFYEPGTVIDHVVETDINSSGRDLLIPAGDPNFEVTWGRTFEEDTYLLSMGPHAHYRGKSFQYELEYPNGDREVLLWIPDYDFNWQLLYQFNEPRFIPAGSTLHATWWFDNSPENEFNPDPTVDVSYGIETFNEMANARIYYASATPRGIVVGDPLPEDIETAAREAEDRRRRQIQATGAVEDHN
ncbi:MAG: cytochrome c [Gemmatimonadota bacterium]